MKNRDENRIPQQALADRFLRALATETASKLDVLGLDGDTLGMDGTARRLAADARRRNKGRGNIPKVGVLKERDKVSLNGLLKSTDSRRLEAQVRLEVLRNLTDEALEGELADQKLSRLLVPTDLTESDGTRLVAVRLLHCRSRQTCSLAKRSAEKLTTTGRRGGLASSLGTELLTGSFSSGRLASGL